MTTETSPMTIAWTTAPADATFDDLLEELYPGRFTAHRRLDEASREIVRERILAAAHRLHESLVPSFQLFHRQVEVGTDSALVRAEAYLEGYDAGLMALVSLLHELGGVEVVCECGAAGCEAPELPTAEELLAQ